MVPVPHHRALIWLLLSCLLICKRLQALTLLQYYCSAGRADTTADPYATVWGSFRLHVYRNVLLALIAPMGYVSAVIQTVSVSWDQANKGSSFIRTSGG